MYLRFCYFKANFKEIPWFQGNDFQGVGEYCDLTPRKHIPLGRRLVGHAFASGVWRSMTWARGGKKTGDVAMTSQ